MPSAYIHLEIIRKSLPRILEPNSGEVCTPGKKKKNVECLENKCYLKPWEYMDYLVNEKWQRKKKGKKLNLQYLHTVRKMSDIQILTLRCSGPWGRRQDEESVLNGKQQFLNTIDNDSLIISDNTSCIHRIETQNSWICLNLNALL